MKGTWQTAAKVKQATSTKALNIHLPKEVEMNIVKETAFYKFSLQVIRLGFFFQNSCNSVSKNEYHTGC